MEVTQAGERYALALERQVAALGARMNLPEPGRGGWFLRLVRMPAKGVETIIDLERRGPRTFLTVSRALAPVREIWEQAGRPDKPMRGLPVEIGIVAAKNTEPLAREIERGTPGDCFHDLSDDPAGDHYLLFHTDTRECFFAGITAPYERPEAEAWQRLINRSYGAELVPPRRRFPSFAPVS